MGQGFSFMMVYLPLEFQLEWDYYYDSEESHKRLLQTLQTTDCREMITAAVDGDCCARAFLLAAYRGHVDVLEAFLNHGINIDIKDAGERTALMLASCKGHEESVRILLEHNANVDLQLWMGWTALMEASMNGHTKIVEMLLENNANPDLQDNDGMGVRTLKRCKRGNGMTALMYASERRHKEIVQLLLNHGVNIDLKNNDGKTTLDLAKDKKIKALIRNHMSISYVLK